MKARSNFYIVVSAILTLTMLLSLLPLQIFAVDPSTLEPDAIFKNMYPIPVYLLDLCGNVLCKVCSAVYLCQQDSHNAKCRV